MSYESCVIDAAGNCTRWNHDHEPPGVEHAVKAESTDEDRERAAAVLSGPPLHEGWRRELTEKVARALAEQREQLTRVDLYDNSGDIDLAYGSPDWIPGDDYLICYTLTLPSGHIFRLAPWQLRALATAIEAENP